MMLQFGDESHIIIMRLYENVWILLKDIFHFEEKVRFSASGKDIFYPKKWKKNSNACPE